MMTSTRSNETIETEGETEMAKISYTTTTLAAEIDTTPKELRKFLRSDLSGIEKVGKGGRYNIELTATQLTKTKKNFAKWVSDAEAKRAANAAALEAAKAEKVEVTEGDGAVTENDIAELDEEFEISDPTEADLELVDDADDDLDLSDIDEA